MTVRRRSLAISADTWSRWWNRLIQLTGWTLGVYECSPFVRHAQLAVLVFAGALILGGAGLRLLVRGLVGVIEDIDDAERADDHADRRR